MTVTDDTNTSYMFIYTSSKSMPSLRERPMKTANQNLRLPITTVNRSCPCRHSGGLCRLRGGEGQMGGHHHRHCLDPPQSASPPHRNCEPLWFLSRISPHGPCLGASSFSRPCHDFCLCVFLSWTCVLMDFWIWNAFLICYDCVEIACLLFVLCFGFVTFCYSVHSFCWGFWSTSLEFVIYASGFENDALGSLTFV